MSTREVVCPKCGLRGEVIRVGTGDQTTFPAGEADKCEVKGADHADVDEQIRLHHKDDIEFLEAMQQARAEAEAARRTGTLDVA